MITITYKGKTYKLTEKAPRREVVFTTDTDIEKWIEEGYLEEVKENKEMPDIVQREEEAKEGMKQVWDSIRKAQEPSILEKLRGELGRMDRLLEEMESFCSSDYIDGRKFQLGEISDFLTSLETSPISKMETTQFTPGQMIEVSKKTTMKVGEKTFEITIKSI